MTFDHKAALVGLFVPIGYSAFCILLAMCVTGRFFVLAGWLARMSLLLGGGYLIGGIIGGFFK